MGKKLTGWKTKGMNKDLSVSAFNAEFAFENRNLRLSTNEGNTLMSWVNERGTLPLKKKNVDDSEESQVQLTGMPIGTAVINHQLVVFTTESELGTDSVKKDHIYLLKYEDHESMSVQNLYIGNLGFDSYYPIETLVSYESDSIQKVYWTDGKNQPRVINIAGKIKDDLDTQFDFVPEIQLNETVKVKKILGASGVFAPGVIQYAFTYYNKYGQESNIFHVTPLYYISYADRGASPEDKVENAFQITVENPDRNFDFLRIYSIQRTSINGTPICKRIQDIALDNLREEKVSYLDTGTSGDTVDPAELLYKGGETISAETIEQKDSTLFLGNIKIDRPSLRTFKDQIKGCNIVLAQRWIKNYSGVYNNSNYAYWNQLSSIDWNPLSSIDEDANSVPCGGFKRGEDYRFGVQFQYKSGKWSEPFHIKDWQTGTSPKQDNGMIKLPIFEGQVSSNLAEQLWEKGYRRVRAVVVYPEAQDRKIVCQGVINPTVKTKENSDDRKMYQSSWFFRTKQDDYENSDESKTVAPCGEGSIPYTDKTIENNGYNPENIRQVEIQGQYDSTHKFQVDYSVFTLHSPDVEFDDSLANRDYSNVFGRMAGTTAFTNTFSDIDIQTVSPTISNSGTGFIHKSFVKEGSYGIVSGLFYDDFIVDDNASEVCAYVNQRASCKWMIYPWQMSGSLNNDINRPSDKGTRTAELKKKVISNLRYASSSNLSPSDELHPTVQFFNSEEASLVKLGKFFYQGNVDTMLMPDDADGLYFAWDGIEEDPNSTGLWNIKTLNYSTNPTSFTSDTFWKTWSDNADQSKNEGIKKYNATDNKWEWPFEGDAGGDKHDIGDEYVDLVMKKAGVRMKYKSTPHLVLSLKNPINCNDKNTLIIVEINSDNINSFGGTSPDTLKENIWIPCGEPELLKKGDAYGTSFEYSWGDTYYQRYDCLKTYPFSRDDPNQIVEIGSFMLETHVNIDGRYDRNRGQINNLNMTPQNFNLINPVYSQLNNFFTYKIQDEDFYNNLKYNNQVTWTKDKHSGEEIDQWTNTTLASVLELDGDKGEVHSIKRFNDQLVAFQDSGISMILYNESTQIATTSGVPIEISNSGKVQGKRYVSNTIGCNNKWSIAITPNGIYFMDSTVKDIWLYNGQLQNVSANFGLSSWCKALIPSLYNKWTPSGFNNFVTYYDSLNQDVLFINHTAALAFSERVGAFTSFYDYGLSPYFCNLDSTGIWIRQDGTLWKHREGEYCNFFGMNKPYATVLVGNPEPQIDKIFTNLEFRACVDGEGSIITDAEENPAKTRYVPYVPFDYIETWNEYQHGIANIDIRKGRDNMIHHSKDGNAALIRKFRMWRCDIPRDNATTLVNTENTFTEVFDNTFHPALRINHPNDRMRNPWLYIKLQKNAAKEGETLHRAEIHDVVMTYFV